MYVVKITRGEKKAEADAPTLVFSRLADAIKQAVHTELSANDDEYQVSNIAKKSYVDAYLAMAVAAQALSPDTCNNECEVFWSRFQSCRDAVKAGVDVDLDCFCETEVVETDCIHPPPDWTEIDKEATLYESEEEDSYDEMRSLTESEIDVLQSHRACKRARKA